jgi:hypothetical protein
MLYLRNTNQLQTLGQEIVRGTSVTPPEPPVTSSYFSGLGRTEYQPAFGGQGAPAFTPSSYTGSQYVSGSTVADSGSLQPTFLASNLTGSAQWLGYFKPSTTETYTFYLNLDDAAVWWIGNEATASLPLSSSAVVDSTFAPPYIVRSGSIALTSGSYVPVKIQYTGVSFPDYFTASFSTPTITQTTDFTGYTFCNTASLGF